ncbi:MAG: DUF4230 domain-containing protein [Acidimicrobiia bacterium]|nr:DUF4230 domain-containing protein [Acidimicrobiia bacterium]
MADTSMSSKVGALVIGGVLILGAFFIGSAVSGFSLFGGGEEYTDISQTVVEQVRNVAELTTVEVIESTTIEKGNDFGWLNWARGDRIFMFVVVEIGAGIDFEDFYTGSFDVDKETGTVTVAMPPAEITYVAVDNEQTQVIDRSTGVLTGGDAQLEGDARQVAEQVLVENAIKAGILEKAETNARTVIEGLLLELGYSRVIFTQPSAGS